MSPTEWALMTTTQQGAAWKLTQDWKKFLGHEIGQRETVMDMPWGTGGHTLFWPNLSYVKDVDPQHNHGTGGMVEYTEDIRRMDVINFPSCAKGGSDSGTWRYLQQVDNFVVVPVRHPHPYIPVWCGRQSARVVDDQWTLSLLWLNCSTPNHSLARR